MTPSRIAKAARRSCKVSLPKLQRGPVHIQQPHDVGMRNAMARSASVRSRPHQCARARFRRA